MKIKFELIHCLFVLLFKIYGNETSHDEEANEQMIKQPYGANSQYAITSTTGTHCICAATTPMNRYEITNSF